jgi:hypothetical protein
MMDRAAVDGRDLLCICLNAHGKRILADTQKRLPRVQRTRHVCPGEPITKRAASVWVFAYRRYRMIARYEVRSIHGSGHE